MRLENEFTDLIRVENADLRITVTSLLKSRLTDLKTKFADLLRDKLTDLKTEFTSLLRGRLTDLLRIEMMICSLEKSSLRYSLLIFSLKVVYSVCY